MPLKESNVTVVVPVYNVEQYLRRCVDSLLRQTLRPLEIILVNDGSLDRSATICDEYAAAYDYVKVISKANGGLSSARCAGWKAAKGDLICFIDSDDYVSDTFLEELARPFVDSSVELSICSWATDNSGNITANSLPYNESNIANGDIPERYILPILGTIPGALNLPGFAWIRMYTKALLHESDFVSEREYFTEDIILNILYASRIKGDIAIVNKPLYYYCINPGSLTLKYRENGFAMRLACNRLCRELTTNLNVNESALDARLRANLVSATMYGIFNVGRLRNCDRFKAELKAIFSAPEVRHLFDCKQWPKATFWQKIVASVYRLKAYFALYTLLKIRNAQ